MSEDIFRCRAFWSGGSGKFRLGAFSPSLHATGQDLKGADLEHAMDGWYIQAGTDFTCSVIANTICSTNDYDKVVKFDYTSGVDPGMNWDCGNTMAKPFVMKLHIAIGGTINAGEYFAITTSAFDYQVQFYNDAVDGLLIRSFDGADYETLLDPFEYNTVYRIRIESYNATNGDRKIEIYLDDEWKFTHTAEEFGSFTYLNFKISDTDIIAYVFLIDHTRSLQYSKTRANIKWEEISGTYLAPRIDKFVERLDEPMSLNLILHNPHNTLISTFKDAANEEIIVVLVGEAPGEGGQPP